MSNDIVDRLKQMQESYDSAPVGGYGDKFAGLDDDDYQGRVEKWETYTGKADPDAYYVKMFGSIQHHAEHAGREVEFFFNATDPEKLGFLKDHFYALGVRDLDMTQLVEGSELFNELLDVPFLFSIYTNKKGYRNAVVRKRLDGEAISDLGTGQEQIKGFERNEPTQAQRAKNSGRPQNCICADPASGQFDENCPVPGHGINF